MIKRKSPEHIREFLKHVPKEICISSISFSEVMYGVEKSKAKGKNIIIMLYSQGYSYQPLTGNKW